MIKRFLNLFSSGKPEIVPAAQTPMTTSIGNTNQSNTTLTEKEIEEFVNDEIRNRIRGEREEDSELFRFDTLLEDAARLVVMHQQGSGALLQRKMKLGYNRAHRIIDQLGYLGIVGKFEGSQAVKVHVSSETELEGVLASRVRRSSVKKTFFDEHVLQSKLEYINQKVEEARLSEELAFREKVKAEIRTELLEKEKLRKEQERMQDLRSQVLKEMIDSGEISEELSKISREPIPQSVKDLVWNRDGGKCVVCGLSEKLEFDHIIPFSKGGANTYRNLQLLCEACNRAKSAKIG